MSGTVLRSSPVRAGVIRGDEQEHNRIQLEHNLQHTDLSLHLSSQPESEQEHHYESSVEYPRHNSGPTTERSFNAFASFDGDDFVSHSHLHAWSYRTADDDDFGAIDPYGGTSMSTAAHHASALTLSAGLRGRGGGHRDISLSGAEYDPDRPLGNMIAGADSRFSMYDVDPSAKSKYQASTIAFDPLVVDDTAELDRVLESGRAITAASLAARLRSTAESSSGSDSDTSNRPKLSDALQRVSTFSPKRPRSAPINQHQGAGPSTTTYRRSHSSPTQAVNFDTSQENNIPTPRPRSKRAVARQPEVHIQPPTPSSIGSQFTKMARGLAKSIEEEQRNIWSEAIKGGSPQAQSTVHERRGKSRAGPQPAKERSPFSDIANAPGSGTGPAAVSAHDRKGAPRAAKVHLPDVTGLTSAVASPAKNGLSYYEYEAGDEPQAAEARFLSVLTAVQAKLAHLESENAISRRRVRELERELETCKAEVAREQTRVLERESIIAQREDAAAVKARRSKGGEKIIRFEEDEELKERYKEVVEEKKALEALITTLRTHLSRLTSELSSHQELLAELRALRETDARTLREKSIEVERLRDEVERLAGEVEVLKEVVEDGLNERRTVREASKRVDGAVQNRDDSEEEESPSIGVRPHADRTIRTDRATLGVSTNDGSPLSKPFIEGDEVDRISLELEARRSDRSGGSAGSLGRTGMDPNHGGHRSRAPSPSSIHRVSAIPTEANHPTIVRPEERSVLEQDTCRVSHSHSKAGKVNESPSTPFPQIRGGHLERLFFSAPEHNAKTCNVCHRRSKRPQSPSWIPRQRVVVEDPEGDEDEGFAEGPDLPRVPRDKGKRREHVAFSQNPRQWRQDGSREGLPPQTVLAKVLRELEDDFTHYKGIYLELAEQYSLMDARSNVDKRNVLAGHLHEVIDTLEQKGDQIASLYDLLSFKDKPVSESIVPEKRQCRHNITSSCERNRGLKKHPTFA